jgi:hypothetical protein
MPTTGIGNASGSVEYAKSINDQYTKYIADMQAQQQALMDKQKTETSGWKSLITGSKSPDQVTQEAQAKWDLEEAKNAAEVAEIQTLIGNYDKLKAEEQAALDASANKLAPMTFIRGEQLQIQNTFGRRQNELSAEINRRTAFLEYKQGRLDKAQEYVKNAVAAATAEQKYNMDMYNFFYDENQDIINSLDTKITNALNQSRADAKWVYEQSVAAAQRKFDNDLKLAKPGTNNGASDTKFWSAITSGKNELQQGEPWGNVWNRIKQQFPNASDTEIDNALGVSWRLPGAYQSFKDKTMQTVTPQEESDINFKSSVSNLKAENKSKSEAEAQYKKDNGVTSIPEADQNIIDEVYKPGFWGGIGQKLMFWQ